MRAKSAALLMGIECFAEEANHSGGKFTEKGHENQSSRHPDSILKWTNVSNVFPVFLLWTFVKCSNLTDISFKFV